jgi:ribosomal protein L37AE/L43A
MPRIDTTDHRSRWRFKCPECDSENWRCNDGNFECRRCGSTSEELRDGKTGEVVPREAFEFVGPESAHKAAYRR